MDNVKRYTATEVRFSTQGGSFVRAADFDALKVELAEAKEFQPIGEACLTNRDELRAMLGLSTPGENLHDVVKALHQDALRYRWLRGVTASAAPGQDAPDFPVIAGLSDIYYTDIFTGADADAAVDDAMTKEPASE